MAPVFPYLPGLGWPVERVMGNFDTTSQMAMSGKKNNYSNRTQAIYKYTLVLDGLDSSGAAINAGLLANSQQLVAGFFNQCLGSALIFNFWDVDDNVATAQEFGVTDGVSNVYQLSRTLGGWSDNVFAPLVSGSPVLVPSPNGGTVNAPFPEPEIFVAGVQQMSGVTVNPANGQVTFASTPAGGQALTWTGNFYWPCNFDDDALPLSKMWSGTWELKKLGFTTRLL